jgi:two-component system, NtrC family, sensor histidine kinase PilS
MARGPADEQTPVPDRASFRRLQRYLAGRSAVLLLFLGIAAVLWLRGGELPLLPGWFSGATAAAFAFTLASALLLQRRKGLEFLSKLQPAWDVAYATCLVYLSGGALSPLSGIYPLVILGGAILFSRAGALVLAGSCSIAYGLLVDLQLYGLIDPPNSVQLSGPDGPDLVSHLAFTIAAFGAVSLLAGFLAEELRKTDRRLEQVEAEFLDLEHLKESILDSMPSGLVALDSRGREAFHNRAAEELLRKAGLRLEPKMALGNTFELEAGARKEAVFDGGRMVLGYTVSPLFDREGRARGSILVFQDLTQVKRLEGDLRRADRLAAVGRLAAGLAHEIRNPLAALSGSTEVLRENLQPGEEDEQLFRIVLRETERLNRLVTDFLHYARPERVERAEVDLQSFVEEVALFFLQGEGKDGFALENRVPAGTTLTADRAQLEQIFLNLFRNSKEASRRAVRVTVEARPEPPSVCLSVRDDGPGLAPEVAARAFEPFYSTKDGGTGLGLATVHRLVESHGGAVSLESNPGEGTEVRFRFPARGSDEQSAISWVHREPGGSGLKVES